MNSDINSILSSARQHEERGEFAKALPHYSHLVEVSDDPRFMIAYGICLQKLGHWKESIAHLQRGIECHPKYGEGDALLHLAEAFVQTGNIPKAQEQWHKILALGPQYPSYHDVTDEAQRLLRVYEK